MPGIFLGGDVIKAIKVGDQDAKAVYVGSEQVWPSGPGPLPPNPLFWDATYTWFHDPRAFYDATSNKTFVTWSAVDGIWIGSYDHTTNAVDRFQLSAEAISSVDDHNVASFLIRNSDGKILALYSTHNGNLRSRVSTNARDASAWGSESTVLSGSNTYPNLVQLSAESGRIYCFYRKGTIPGPQHYITSTDGGATWSSETTLFSVSGERPYFKVASNGDDRIDFACTNGHPDETNSSVYHFWYDANDGEFKTTDGTSMGTMPFDASDATPVYDGTSVDGWVWDIALDGTTPVIVHAVIHSSSDHRYNYARWNGSSWDNHQITAAGKTIYETGFEPSYSAGVVLNHADPSVVYLSREVTTDRWEIEEWETSDHGSSWSSTAITSNSPATGTYKQYRPVAVRGNGPIKLIWAQGNYVTYTQFASRLVANPGVVLPTGFDPTIPGVTTPQARYDAQRLVDVQGFSNNDPVGGIPWYAWPHGWRLTQSSSGSRPLVKTGVTPSGLAAVYFDGGDRLGATNGALPLLDIRAATTLLVFQMQGSSQAQMIAYRDSGSSSDRWYMMASTTQFQVFVGATSANLGARDTNWHVMVLRGDGNNKKWWLDGSSGTFTDSNSGTPGVRSMGMGTGTSDPFTGHIATFIQWDVPLSDAEVATVISAMEDRFLV